MTTIKSTSTDENGRLIFWLEGDYAFTLTRDATTGKPLHVRGVSGGRPGHVGVFNYDGSGNFLSFVGEVPSMLLQSIILEASVGSTGDAVTVVNSLTSTSTTSALSAAQGKVLQDGKAPRGGPGAALGATYTAVDADDGKIWPTPVNCAVTVNAGLIAGFGQGFTGAGVVSFVAGAGVTFPADYDKRTTGATNPVCSLVNIGTNTYEIWGTKQ